MKRMFLLFGGCTLTLSVFSQQPADLNNKLAGTSTVMVAAAKSDAVINPNPVQGTTFNLELLNLAKGKYTIYMYSEAGKRHLVKVLNFEGGNFTESLQLPKNADKGVYILQVIGKNARIVKKMIVE